MSRFGGAILNSEARLTLESEVIAQSTCYGGYSMATWGNPRPVR
jgi:hypothetical protein